MQAFISYSFNNKEIYIISLLIQELREKKFFVNTSDDFYNHEALSHYIKKCDLFVGIITRDGHNTSKVVKEWTVAKEANIPNLLLVEKGITIGPRIKAIVFDRNNPQAAVTKLVELSKPLKNQNVQQYSPDVAKEFLAISLVAVGIASLISLLAKKN